MRAYIGSFEGCMNEIGSQELEVACKRIVAPLFSSNRGFTKFRLCKISRYSFLTFQVLLIISLLAIGEEGRHGRSLVPRFGIISMDGIMHLLCTFLE